MNFRLFAGFEDTLLGLPGVVPMLLEEAQAVESRIVIPPTESRDRVETFAHASEGVTARTPYGQAGMRGPAALAIEFGSRRNAPYAPVRRAAHGG
mgnify:CR=1 FL=1